LPVEEKFGGLVGKVSDKLYWLKRGQIYEIEGNTIFTFGGAASTDKKWRLARDERLKTKSWWPQEVPTRDELDFAHDNLKRVGYKVDYQYEAKNHLVHGVDESDLVGSLLLLNILLHNFKWSTTDTTCKVRPVPKTCFSPISLFNIRHISSDKSA